MGWYRNSKSKYNNKKVEVDGIKFDSKAESKRYEELHLLEMAGEIQNLQRQVEFKLIPTQREPDWIGSKGGIHKGKVIEHSVCYKADFVYDLNGQQVVEDVKGFRTEEYKIKKKLMLWIHGIQIQEIGGKNNGKKKTKRCGQDCQKGS